MLRGNEHYAKSPLTAVILDYGQVVSLRPSAKQMAPLAAIFGMDPNIFRKIYPLDRGPYDSGSISPTTFWLKFADKVRVPLDCARIPEIRRLDVEMWSAVDPHMVQWIDSLLIAGFKTALLSNMISDMAAHARREFTWMKRLTCQVLSCEIGLIKPDQAIYQHCLKRMDVAPAEALFIDDHEPNVQMARKLGIPSIQFNSVSQLRSELSRLSSARMPPIPSI